MLIFSVSAHNGSAYQIANRSPTLAASTPDMPYVSALGFGLLLINVDLLLIKFIFIIIITITFIIHISMSFAGMRHIDVSEATDAAFDGLKFPWPLTRRTMDICVHLGFLLVMYCGDVNCVSTIYV